MRALAKEPDFPLGHELDFLQCLWQLNHALERCSRRMERSLGVTAQQRFVLRCLGRYPGITAGQLARLLHVDPSTLSASLRRLQRRGLLERRKDPLDSRRASLGLTAKGRAADVPSPATVESAAAALLAQLPRGEVARVEKVLERFCALLGDGWPRAPAR